MLRPMAIAATNQETAGLRALVALAGRLTRVGPWQLQSGSQLQGSVQQPLIPFTAALDDERRNEQPQSDFLRSLHAKHAVIPGLVYDRWHRQPLWPLAARQHVSLPLDITSRRHISFMRFLSVSEHPSLRTGCS
jgi:hypothetical protein